MKRILQMLICLVIGIFIGLNFKDDVSIIKIKSYDGKMDGSQIEFYDNMIKDVNAMEIYDTSKINEEILTNRNGKIIVEKIVGEVTNYKLDGKILNCNAKNQGYINYERVDGAKEGDRILTYYIYNPFTNEQDDVLTRLDFVIDDNAI